MKTITKATRSIFMEEENIILETMIGDESVEYTIMPMESKFGISCDGLIIAEISHNEDWELVSGAPMSEDLFRAITYKIEAYYD